MKRKIIALLLCFVCVSSLCFPVAADDDGYSAIISDIDKTCPTCGSALHAFWWSTSGAEVEVEISDTGKIKIPAGAGAIAHIDLKCKSCGYEKKETRLLGLDFGAEKPGKLVQAPSGIGRKDLPGYNDDNGTPTIGADGFPTLTFKMLFNGFSTSFGGSYLYGSPFTTFSNGTYSISSTYNMTGFYVEPGASSAPNGCISYYFDAPYTGYYKVSDAPFSVKIVSRNKAGDIFPDSSSCSKAYYASSYTSSEPPPLGTGVSFSLSVGNQDTLNLTRNPVYIVKGQRYFFHVQFKPRYGFSNTSGSSITYFDIAVNFPAPTITVTDISSIATINKQTNITINNDYSQTWNGNIYIDNSTNLTYIYPQYTTINEKNETVTNISNTPIIYNNETKQYYTYDETTKNYYYITYVTTPTPTPSPVPEPSSTPNPSITPSPTPTPGGSGTGGGDVSTPETGKPGGSSGSSWWDKLLSKIGDAIIDGLLGAVSAVLKLIFKLLSTILSWIIWAVSRVFDLLPFLPPGLGGLLVGGVVVCFVIGIIKFIRG